MHKIFTFFIFLYFVSASSVAQFVKGQKLIGGNLSLSTVTGDFLENGVSNNSINHNSNTGIGLNISMGKFVNEKSLWGIGLGYYYNDYINKQKIPLTDNRFKYYSHSGGINIFNQRFISLGSRFFFTILANANVTYGYSKQVNFADKVTSKGKGYSIGVALTPGLTYQINNRFLLDATLNNFIYAFFQHSNASSIYPLPQEVKTSSNSFSISTSLSNTNIGNVGLGFRWLLKNK